jgi:hypothetical protein
MERRFTIGENAWLGLGAMDLLVQARIRFGRRADLRQYLAIEE